MNLPRISIPFRLARILAPTWMGAIYYSSTQPSLELEGVNQSLLDHFLDSAHLPAYFVMTIFLAFSFKRIDTRSLVSAAIVAASFGILNEFIQLSVPGRSFSYKDMLMNASGALLAAWYLRCVTKERGSF